MIYPALQSEPLSLDDFDEMLADQPEGERWELIDGRIVRMMVGARWEHARIISNLHYQLRRRFEEQASSCRVFTETFRLRDEAIQASLLPDVIVACEPLPVGATSLDRPTVIIEVLSPGTARRDREEKWAVYRRLSSLRHYALVARDAPRVEVFDRQGETWSGFRLAEGPAASLDLPTLGVSIPLTDVYADLLG